MLRTLSSIERAFADLPHTSAGSRPLKFLAVPGHDGTRWLVPEDGRGVDAVLANWSPYRFSSRITWHAIRGANRLEALRFLPSVMPFELQGASDVDWWALGWNGCAAPALAIYIGTPSQAWKAVVHLVSLQSSVCDAVLKLPLTAGAKDATLREAQTLSILADQRHSQAPRLLSVDRKRGVSMQEFIAGRPGSRRLRPEYLELLRSLLLPDERITMAAYTSEWDQQTFSLSDRDAGIMCAALERLKDDLPLPACWAHGDFAPWNIRARQNLPPALIDWEEGKQSGLPLVDAYHFLHIQDFLFGGKPTLHGAELSAFGRSLGLSADHCRKLETAYLAQAYLQCRSRRDQARSDFLMKSLAMAVAQPCAVACLPNPRERKGFEANAATSDLAKVRADLFDRFVAALDDEGVHYCVLGGHHPELEAGESDVDIMVREPDLRCIPQLLARTARSAGALLVQAMQHETTATYFVLARMQGEAIARLDVDCYSDYRRSGRTWLLADKLIAGRRKYRSFYVPSVADEFTYYLIKKVLKQAISAHQLRRLHHLLARDPVQCRARIANFWPGQALPLERAIATQDLAWLERQFPALWSELKKSPPAEGVLQCWAGKLYELARCWQRVVHPAGMWVEIAGKEPARRTEIALQLTQRLAPAFRRTHVTQTPKSLTATLDVLNRRIRSTLVVSCAGEVPPQRRILLKLRLCLVAPDLVLSLEAEPSEEERLFPEVVRMNASDDPVRFLQFASQAVLQRLALRQQERLDLPFPDAGTTATVGTKQAELSPAGSD